MDPLQLLASCNRGIQFGIYICHHDDEDTVMTRYEIKKVLVSTKKKKKQREKKVWGLSLNDEYRLYNKHNTKI
jgi:hypothetical protein